MNNIACNTVHESYRLSRVLLPVPRLLVGWDYSIARRAVCMEGVDGVVPGNLAIGKDLWR